MPSIQITQELYCFLGSIAIGIFFGLLYDLFRILRISIPNTLPSIVFLEDIIFSILVSICGYFYLLNTQNGKIRGFILIGYVIGFIVYYFSLGIVVIKLSKVIVKMLTFILSIIYRILVSPILKVIKFFITPVSIFIKKVILNVKKDLKNLFRMLYNLCNKILKGKIKLKKGVDEIGC